jgi:RHH-type rel operon transcriptional repressor/antitoxin RelB
MGRICFPVADICSARENVYMSTDVVSIRLPSDVKRRLDVLAASTGRPAAFYVREAIQEHLSDIEWAYDVAAHAEAARSGVAPTKPLDDVAREFGFDPHKLRAEAQNVAE